MNRPSQASRRLLVVLACMALAFSIFALPARADVTSVGGGAFGASINGTLLGQILPPTPQVTLPSTGGGPFTDSAIPISIPGLLTANVLDVSTQGGLLGTHQGFAQSSAQLAEVTVGGLEPVTPPALTLQAVRSDCLSNGDGSSGSTDIIGLFAGAPLPTNPTPNFVPSGPLPAGVASIVINEQIVSNVTGATSITVNAVHIVLLPTGGTGLVDIIIGQSRCAAAGPDVNTGQVAVVKDAPDDAQDVEFTFTITCPGLAGSPFTRTVTGDGTTDPVINVPTGTVCTASEDPVAGFVNQPPQTFPPVASGATQTVTFVNARVAQTGAVAVIKDAPDDAQTVNFTFTITCPGVAGSPFTRTVTGNGTSTAVTGIPAGTVCTASEADVVGFVPQPDQNFPAVVANTTRTVTFFNQRADANTGAVAVVKQAPDDADDVVFTFTITCTGVAGSPFTRTVTGSGTSAAVGNLPVGTVCTAAEAPVAGFNNRPNQTFPAVTAGGTATVTFVNTRTTAVADPTITVVKTANPASRPEPGGTFTFTVQVTNTGSQPVLITSITDDVHGNLNGRGTCDAGVTIPAGSTYTCAFSVQFTGESGDSETDRVTVVVVDAGGRTGSDTSAGATISITDRDTGVVRGPTIIINNDNRATAECVATSASAGTYRIAQINVDNNNSAECVATSTSAQTTPTSTKAPTHTTTPTGKVLARTGADSLALAAFALALMVTGSVLMSNKLAADRHREE